MASGPKNKIDNARTLGSSGNYAAAIELLEGAATEADRATFTGEDIWLEAQAEIISLLGWNGLNQLQLSLDRFDAVRADFEQQARRADWPHPADEVRAKVRHCQAAWNRIRTCHELGRLDEALEAAKYANEVLATVPEGAEHDSQKACLLVECAGVLRSLGRKEDAGLLSAEAGALISTRVTSLTAEASSRDLSALEDIGNRAQALISRLEDLDFSEACRDIAIAYQAGAQRLVELEPDKVEHRHRLASSVEALGMAYSRLGDSRCRECLESAAEIYRASAANGDAVARAHLGRVQKNVGVLLGSANLEQACRAFRESMDHHRALWEEDPSLYGPAFLDVLRKFCAATSDHKALSEERRAALAEANRVIERLDAQQASDCAYAIGWCYLHQGKMLISETNGESRSAYRILGKALSALRQSELTGRDAGSELREVKALRFTLASTAPVRRRRSASRKYEQRRRRVLRNGLMLAGAILAIVLGSIVVMVVDDDPEVRCAKIETDAQGEQVCVQFETREGVVKRKLP